MLGRLRFPVRKYGALSSSYGSHVASLGRNPVQREPAKIPELHVGNEVEGFVVERIENVPEFHLTAVSLKHLASGAQYLHLQRNDSNNTFSVGFRTTPTDSTGLPHILEHTTLCGSMRYPCRDPFFKMLNRSMATFMNAMTGPDYTIYPFATQNPYDFNNLMSVYLDAVFKPQLRETDFRQEGWRLEHEDVRDPNSPIVFKGVVFNEMKGVFSDSQSVFGQTLLNHLLPSHTYGHVSGGHPLHIPKLTYEDLVQFHRKFYNPSNARFYSYGNFPLADHLTYINQNYLSTWETAEKPDASSTAVPKELRWDSVRRKHIPCRLDPLAADPKKQSTVAVSVLLDDIQDLKKGFDWNVLSELLVKGPNAAFYKTLVEPQIGSGFSPVTGYDSQVKDTFFSVGLQGVNPDDFDKVIHIFDQTVDGIIEKGFDPNHVEAVLHGIELAMKHESSGFGLGLLFGLTPLWNHDGDIIGALHVNDQLKDFRERIKNNPRYLQEVVEGSMKGNKHRLILTMSPDENYESQLSTEEKDLLDSKLSTLNKEQHSKLFQMGLDLVSEQEKYQDTTCLPTLRVDDLKRELDQTNLVDRTIEGVPVQVTGQPTNGIIYFRGILNVSSLSEEQKKLLPLFTNIVSLMGTMKRDYRQLDQEIKSKTGGIGFSTHLSDDPSSLTVLEEGILFSSHALDRNMANMFQIIAEIFNELSLTDVKRFETLVKMIAARLANHITDTGHHYAMVCATSMVTGAGWRKERYMGMTHVSEMRRIAQLTDLSDIVGQLKEIAKSVLTKSHLRCAVNFSPESEGMVMRSMEEFFKSLPGSVKQPFVQSPVPIIHKKNDGVHHTLPIPVNFAAKSISAVSFQHKDYAPLRVLARLLSSKYLHPMIREKGGAYGSGATLSSSGSLTFFSYRDPNSTGTLQTFDNSVTWVRETGFSDQDIEEAKLGVFQQVDAPIPPGQKGMNRFLYGVSDVVLQEHRKRLMAVKKEDLITVASQYLSNSSNRLCGRALIGPQNKDLLSVRKNEKWQIETHE